MNILAALKREEVKFEKQASAAQHQLDTVRSAIKLFGSMNGSGKSIGRKKRVLSASARAKMARAQRERWAKFRAAKGKH